MTDTLGNTADSSDVQLVEAYMGGTREALDVLMGRYIKSIHNFSKRFVGQEYADDVVQDTFVKVWKHIKAFDQKRSFRVWLFTIARRQAIDYTRKKKRERSTPLSAFEGEDNMFLDIEDREPLAHEVMEREEASSVVRKAVQTLSRDKQTVLDLRTVQDMTFKEISSSINKPMSTVKSRYRRALMSLRKAL